MRCSYKILTIVAGPATLLTLTACGSGSSTSQEATPSASAPVAAQSAAEELPSPGEFPDEGPVTTADGRSVEYPDGLRIDFVSAESFSAADVERALPGSYDVETDNERDVATDHVAIKVTLKFTNGSPAHIPIEETISMMSGFYGANRLPAETINWAGDDVFGQDPMPTRIASGSSALFWSTFEVPKSDLLTFVVEPTSFGERTPYIFTDIGKVLK